MSGRWVEVAHGVYARRYVELDQTLGLVVGDAHCLVIDTGTDEVHGASMAAAVRFVTPLPWTVVITHAHFDHFFGTAAFLPASVISHERCRSLILAEGERQRRAWSAKYRSEGKAEQADRLATAKLVAPTEVITSQVLLDLGGRTVTLVHPVPRTPTTTCSCTSPTSTWCSRATWSSRAHRRPSGRKIGRAHV